MRRLIIAAVLALGAVPAHGQPTDTARYFEQVCGNLQAINDACGMAQATAEMLSPTYEADKSRRATERLRALGYAAEYIAASGGVLSDTTDVFLIAKPASNRLYVFITGTESARDWYENAKAIAYTTKWRDGYYYTPPGHAGFRSGALNVISAVLKRNEFDNASLVCNGQAAPARASRVAAFICSSGVRSRPDSRVEVVVAGHSRGSAIATLIAPALAGYEIRTSDGGDSASVDKQSGWPLDFAGLVGFAPPYAIYTRTDAAAGMKLPSGAPNQWEVYEKAGIIERTLMFYNDRDIVPLLSLGLGRQIGHRFRITEARKLEYVGINSRNSVDVLQAHGSGGYCHDVLAAFGREDPGNLLCDKRTYSEPDIGDLLPPKES